jgi:TetR/AcrR family transcriptional regulator, transcriptional repressor for nem operon
MSDKRTRLVEAAADLAHRRGFGASSLAEIAEAAGVPLGNVYYYFKTKDALAEALIERWLQEMRTARLAWDAAGGPVERLEACIEVAARGREAVARSGSPIGGLCTELAKTEGPVAQKARALFREQLDWIEAQLRALGAEAEAPALAIHLLSGLQGASLLAHAQGDPALLVYEAEMLKAWVRRLPHLLRAPA